MITAEATRLVATREHIVRLWRLISRDILETTESDATNVNWDAILGPLHIASSIESISADTNHVDDTESISYCGLAAEYEHMHSELISHYVKQLTVLLWTWIALERGIDVLCGGSHRDRSGALIRFMKRKSGTSRLIGVDHLEREAYRLAPSAVKKRIDSIVNSQRKTSYSGTQYLFLHIAREARNHLLHGNAPMPTPMDWGEDTEYRAEDDSNVEFVGVITQLTLLTIQTLLYLIFLNVDQTAGSDRYGDGTSELIQIKTVLRVLHLEGMFFLLEQQELPFG